MNTQENNVPTMETAPEASSNNQLPEPTMKDVGNTNHGQEHWSYAGHDSTAVNEILITNLEDAQGDKEMEEEEVSAWLSNSAAPQVEADVEIKNGVELVRKLTKGYNSLINLTGKNLAERAISLGKVLFRLKHLAKDSGLVWGVWAEKNVPFLSKRNREKFMLLARRKDCHRYSFLGVDRLEMLCSATKESENDDPIGDLLGKYQIAYDDGSELNMAEFKILIDSALNNEKLNRLNIQVPWDLVIDLTRVGVDFDKSFLKKLKDIQDCGGNSQTYLDKLSLNRGKDEAEPDSGKRIQDFNTLSNRLIKTIDYLIEDESQLEKLDKETLSRLWTKLQRLQSVANPAVEDQAA